MIAKIARKTATDPKFKNALNKAYHDFCTLKEPVNASATYDTYISLFGATASDTITLSIQDANAIIHDEWDWAVAAKTTNSSYSSRY